MASKELASKELRLFLPKCPCGAPAKQGLTVQVGLNGELTVDLSLALCVKHIRGEIKLGAKPSALPSHHPVQVEKVEKFPPGEGQIFLGAPPDILIGCPRCSNMVTLKGVFKIEGDELKPSFVCPHCGLHTWLHVV